MLNSRVSGSGKICGRTPALEQRRRLLQRVPGGRWGRRRDRQSQKRDRPVALRQQQVEQRILIVVNDPDPFRRGDLDGPLASLAQYVGIDRQLGIVGITTGQGAALVSHVLVEDGGGKPKAPASTASPRRPAIRPASSGVAARSIDSLAHHVVPERRQRRQEREVHRRLARVGGVHELRERLPIPGNSLVEHVERNTLDIDEVRMAIRAPRAGRARCPTPQLPITTLVTPCQDDGVTAPSQQIWAS